jgi:hypothetical protein
MHVKKGILDGVNSPFSGKLFFIDKTLGLKTICGFGRVDGMEYRTWWTGASVPVCDSDTRKPYQSKESPHDSSSGIESFVPQSGLYPD